MATILCIAGHGQKTNGVFDPGATNKIPMGEHRYMRDVMFPAMQRHVPAGHKVVFFSSYNVYNRGNIVALAKSYGSDTKVCECHFDSGSGSGGHVIVYAGFAPDALDLALRDAIGKNVGLRHSHRGHAGISGRSNLGNCNACARGGVNYRMLELGMSNDDGNVHQMTANVDAYARDLINAMCGSVGAGQPAPAVPAPAVPAPAPQPSGYTGGSIVDYLRSVGMDNSFNARKNYAAQYGIGNYRGTAAQNTQLLNAMRGGSAPAPAPVKSGYTGGSIVDYLNSIGMDSSYSARARYAAQYGIAGYRGTAAQNTRLLNLMRG